MIAVWMLPIGLFAQGALPTGALCPLPILLEKIEAALNIRFAYDASTLATLSMDTTRLRSDPRKVLEDLLADHQLECQRLSDHQYLIRTNTRMLSESEPVAKSITGRVRDSWNGDYLEHVAVFTADLRHGTTTDSLGKFTLPYSPNAGQVVFQMLGYGDLRIDPVQISSNLSISLTPQVQEMPEILIQSKPPVIGYSDHSSAIQWHPSNLLNMGLGGFQSDVLKAMQWLPGVNAGDDLNALPGVRSNQPDQNLILLNDMPLLKVDHYFGIFSALPPNLIQDVEWYRSYFPANYGERTASIIKLNTLNPSLQNPGWHGQISWDNFTISGLARGAISKHLYLTAAARTTYYELSNQGLFNFLYEAPSDDDYNFPGENVIRNTVNFRETHPSFNFYDGYIGVEGHWDHTNVRMQYFTGFDDFTNRSLAGFAIPNRNEHTLYRSSLSEGSDWRNQAVGLYLDHAFSPRLTWKTWVNYTYYRNQAYNEMNLDRIQAGPFPPVTLSVYDHFVNESSVLETRTELSYSVDPQHTLQFGLHVTHMDNLAAIDLEALPSLNEHLQGQTYQGYAEYIYDSNGWRVESGLRSIYYSVTGKIRVEPRWYLQYGTKTNHRFHIAGGNYHQFLRSSYHEDRYNRSFDFFILANDQQFPTLASWQFTGGWTWQKKDWRIEAEGFYHKLDGWLEYAQEMPGIDGQNPVRTGNYQLYDGKAKQFGVDVLIRHDHPHWPGWIAYTLSKAEQSIPEIRRGEYYPSQNDRRHQLKIVQQYEANRWSLWMGYQYVSGKPYLNILSLGETLRRDIDLSRAISYLPAYQRFDLGATYHLPVHKSELLLSAGIYNLFNHTNVQYRQYVLALEGATNTNLPNQNYVLGNDVSLLPITPFLSISWKF